MIVLRLVAEAVVYSEEVEGRVVAEEADDHDVLQLMPAVLSSTTDFVAASMKSRPIVFEANGKEREARKLHSMHISSVPLTTNWMLTAPVMLGRSTILRAADRQNGRRNFQRAHG